MIFLNKEYLRPKFETLTTWGLFGAGLVVAIGKEGIAEIKHQRRKAQTGNNLAAQALQQTFIEPDTSLLSESVEATAPVVHLPATEQKPDLALSAA